MNLSGLKKHNQKTYPALPLERRLGLIFRQRLARGLSLFVFVIALVWFLDYSRVYVSGLSPRLLLGLLLILLALRLKLFALEVFAADSYYRSGPVLSDWSLALVLCDLRSDDVTGSLIARPLGWEVLLRAGLTHEAVQHFWQKRVGRVALEQIVLEAKSPDQPFSLSDLWRAIIAADRDFKQFLFEQGVTEADFLAAALWVARLAGEKLEARRWWSRAALGRIPGLAKDWSYGQAYKLGRYASLVAALPSSENEYSYNWAMVEKLEAALAREREDNVMLVGDDKERQTLILGLLARQIESGKVLPPLEHKRIMSFNVATFSAANSEKGKFEQALLEALDDAVHAGNLILVFPEFTTLARTAESVGSNLPELLSPYLASPHLQIIANATAGEFHQQWEPKTEVMAHFERLWLDEVGGSALWRILEDEAHRLELKRGLVFTWPALRAMAEGAERYLPEGLMPDAALDLMGDVVTAHATKQAIQKAEVEELIKNKTGIPLGTIDVDERAKLANLEQALHERIVGQNEAVNGLANALRRARAGINNPNRPIGTFLFLGPTGVGKTETTKALAQAYFGDESKIDRLDMSEYSSPEALDKLIGSFATKQTGVLAQRLREQPYGILLLDEFEKASDKVHNLFLQVLDEGYFSDAAGQRVSVRNHIIIATSNAGSDLIWQALSAGKDLLAEKPRIIDELVRQGIFKPELLNRFDGVILFHPLDAAAQKQVARLLLGKLAGRLRERGTDLRVTDELVDYLVEKGADIKFGARAMNRAIQDTIEQAVANKIVIEGLPPGRVISLSRADLL